MCDRVTVVTFPVEVTGTGGLFAHSLVIKLNRSEAICLPPLPHMHSGRPHEHLHLTECDAKVSIFQCSRREVIIIPPQ